TSHPFATLPSQSANDPEHPWSTHRPASHRPTPCATMHASPQPPQLSGSDPMSVSHVCDGSSSQSRFPAAHVAGTHSLPWHALLEGVQGVWQAPQLVMSVATFASHPVSTLASQSRNVP